MSTNDRVLIVDSHLDIAWNALYNGRDLTMTVEDIRIAEGPRTQGTAMTSLASMGEAGIGLVFATLFAEPAETWSDIFSGIPVRPPAERLPHAAGGEGPGERNARSLRAVGRGRTGPHHHQHG